MLSATNAPVLLNASGCLDALTAPEVARSLDAFVTKTITPEPREGNAPVRIAETEAGMLNAIGLANPGRERFLACIQNCDVNLCLVIGADTFALHRDSSRFRLYKTAPSDISDPIASLHR